jgi:hypothetical protein
MAQIILKDKSVYDVDEHTATNVSVMRANPKNKDQQIKISNTLILIGSILKITLEPQQESDPFFERLQNMHNARKAFLKLTPRQKAEQNAWGHFSFFFEGVYGKKPKEDLKSKVIDATEVYYRKNPFVDRPVMALWQKVLQIKEGTLVNSIMFRLLSLQDAMAYKIIEEDAQFEAKRLGVPLSVPEICL